MTIRQAFQERITHAKLNNRDEAERVLCELLDFLDSKGLIQDKPFNPEKLKEKLQTKSEFWRKSSTEYSMAVYVALSEAVSAITETLVNEK